MSIVAWLFALVGPLALRALAGVGFSLMTFGSVTALADTLITQATSSWSTLPSAVLNLAGLSGIPEVLGLTLGAYATRLTIWVAVQASRFVIRGAT